jgi:hypothetical protein
MENLVIVKRRSAKRTENYSLSIFNLWKIIKDKQEKSS